MLEIIGNSNKFSTFLLGILLVAGLSLLVSGSLAIVSILNGWSFSFDLATHLFLPVIVSAPLLFVALLLFRHLLDQRHQLMIEIERKTIAEHRFSRLANTDELTGLGNRRSFVERAREAMALSRLDSQPLALLFIDVDGLKSLNDNEGHVRGDMALRHLARVLRQCLRQTDYAARYGGDEFVILMPNTDMNAATVAAERLRTTIENSSDTIALTVSVGLASTQSGHVGIEELVMRADEALYVAKRAGRNQVCTTFPDGNRRLVPKPETVSLQARSA